MSGNDAESSITRRRLLRSTGAASVVAATGLSGCTGDGGTTPTEGQDMDGTDTPGTPTGTELEVTGVWSGGEEEDFLAVADYVEGQTAHTIQYHPRTTDALLTGTLMDYNSGVAPADVVVMPSPARIRSDGSNGHLASLGDTWDAGNYAVAPSRISAGGTAYAAPFKMDLKPGFWYRESFFEEHGLSEPGSYDDFVSLLDTIAGIEGVDAPLASGNGTGWPLSDLTEAFFLRQDDGAQLQQDLISGDADFTDDRVRTAFQEIKSLHESGYFSQTRNFSVQYEYLWDGSLPLYFMGSWTPAIEAIKDPSDLGVFRLPGTEGMVASVNWFTVPKYSDHVDAAREAVSSFVSKEGQQVWAERGGFIASNTNVPNSAYEVEVMAQLPKMANEVTVVSDLDDSLGNPFQQEFWSQLKGLWSDPSTGIDSIVSALDSAQDESLSD